MAVLVSGQQNPALVIVTVTVALTAGLLYAIRATTRDATPPRREIPATPAIAQPPAKIAPPAPSTPAPPPSAEPALAPPLSRRVVTPAPAPKRSRGEQAMLDLQIQLDQYVKDRRRELIDARLLPMSMMRERVSDEVLAIIRANADERARCEALGMLAAGGAYWDRIDAADPRDDQIALKAALDRTVAMMVQINGAACGTDIAELRDSARRFFDLHYEQERAFSDNRRRAGE